MNWSDRRNFIRISSGVMIVGLAGCSQDTEEVPLSVSYTWGAESHRNHRWGDSQLILEAGDENANEDDFEGNMVDGHIVISTEERIDMSPVSEIECTFKHSSTGGDEDISFFAVSDDREAIKVKPIRYYMGQGGEEAEEDIVNAASNINDALYFKDRDMGARTTETMEVGNVSGSRYVGVGVNCGSDHRQEMNLEVHAIRGFDADDEDLFYLDFTTQSLILN